MHCDSLQYIPYTALGVTGKNRCIISGNVWEAESIITAAPSEAERHWERRLICRECPKVIQRHVAKVLKLTQCTVSDPPPLLLLDIN